MRACVAWFKDVAVGELREEGGKPAFLYYTSWLHRPDSFPLTAGLPLQASVIHDIGPLEGVARFLASSIPATGEWVMRLAMEAGVSEKDTIGLLLQYGGEGMGALSWHAPGRLDSGSGRTPLSLKEAGGMLTSGRIPNGGFLPGRFPKMAVVTLEEGYAERIGNTPSTHLLKTAGAGNPDQHSLLISEWAVQQLANMIGLHAVLPEIIYWNDEGGALLAAPRFDRLRDPFGRQHKLCICLASQLLNVGRDLSLSADVLGRVEGRTLVPIQSRRELFRWAVFNILVGNTAVHLDKLAGVRWTGGWMLTPFFGLRSPLGVKSWKEGRLPDWEAVKVPFRMGEAQAFSELDLNWFGWFGEAMGISRKMAEEITLILADALMGAIDDLPAKATMLASRDKALADWLCRSLIPAIVDQVG